MSEERLPSARNRFPAEKGQEEWYHGSPVSCETRNPFFHSGSAVMVMIVGIADSQHIAEGHAENDQKKKKKEWVYHS